MEIILFLLLELFLLYMFLIIALVIVVIYIFIFKKNNCYVTWSYSLFNLLRFYKMLKYITKL